MSDSPKSLDAAIADAEPVLARARLTKPQREAWTKVVDAKNRRAAQAAKSRASIRSPGRKPAIDRELVARLKTDGKSSEEIGAIVGCTANHVDKILRQLAKEKS